MSRDPRRPSRNSRSVNLRPTMPAAPRTNMCKTYLPLVLCSSLFFVVLRTLGAGPRAFPMPIAFTRDGYEIAYQQPCRNRSLPRSSSCPGIAVRRTASLPLAYVPGIHVLTASSKEDVDGRDKPGHDDCKRPIQTLSSFPAANVANGAVTCKHQRPTQRLRTKTRRV